MYIRDDPNDIPYLEYDRYINLLEYKIRDWMKFPKLELVDYF